MTTREKAERHLGMTLEENLGETLATVLETPAEPPEKGWSLAEINFFEALNLYHCGYNSDVRTDDTCADLREALQAWRESNELSSDGGFVGELLKAWRESIAGPPAADEMQPAILGEALADAMASMRTEFPEGAEDSFGVDGRHPMTASEKKLIAFMCEASGLPHREAGGETAADKELLASLRAWVAIEPVVHHGIDEEDTVRPAGP